MMNERPDRRWIRYSGPGISFLASSLTTELRTYTQGRVLNQTKVSSHLHRRLGACVVSELSRKEEGAVRNVIRPLERERDRNLLPIYHS